MSSISVGDVVKPSFPVCQISYPLAASIAYKIHLEQTYTITDENVGEFEIADPAITCHVKNQHG